MSPSMKDGSIGSVEALGFILSATKGAGMFSALGIYAS